MPRKTDNESIEDILDEMMRDTEPDDIVKVFLKEYAFRLERALRKHDIELLTKIFEKKRGDMCNADGK